MISEKLYAIKIKVAENSMTIIWGGDDPELKPGVLKKDQMKLELSVTRIFHKVLNRGKKELLEIFEKNDFEVLGDMLFKILWSEPAVKSFLYGRLVMIMRDQQAHCRIRIEFDENAYDLAALPWEYLLIQKDDQQHIEPFFWGADIHGQFDLIRHVAPEGHKAEQPSIQLHQPLNVILVINNPADRPVDKLRMITCLEKIRNENELFNLYTNASLINPPFHNLKQQLNEIVKLIEGPYVLHFLGHAHMNKEQSGIFFINDKSMAEEIKSDDFAKLFIRNDRNFPDFRLPDLVVLQACESGQVGEKGNGIGFLLARKGIPAVVAMQNEITEDASEKFVREFYHSLLNGDDIARAVTKGRTYMATRYNKDEKETDKHYSDNTFGSPIVFISSETPFYLVTPLPKEKDKKKAMKCKKCGFRYEDTTLDTCIQNGGRCGGDLEPIIEQPGSTSHINVQSRPTKVPIDDTVPRSLSAN